MALSNDLAFYFWQEKNGTASSGTRFQIFWTEKKNDNGDAQSQAAKMIQIATHWDPWRALKVTFVFKTFFFFEKKKRVTEPVFKHHGEGTLV